MALLRIFQRHKKIPTVAQVDGEGMSERQGTRDSDFPPDCLRLLVFREGDRKERRLLFDSSCVRPRRSSEGSIDAVPSKSNGKIAHSHSNPSGFLNYMDDSAGCNRAHLQDNKFEVTKPPADTTLIGEMIFGAVSMRIKGETLKLHEMRSPSKIMLTKVFPGPKFSRQSHPVISESSDGSESKFHPDNCHSSNPDHSDSDRDSQYSTVHSLNELVTFSARSVPICIPEQNQRSSPSSSSPSIEPNGLVTRSTSHSSLKNVPLSPSSCKSLPGTPLSHSLQRRWLLNSQMSLEFGVKLRSSDQIDEEMVTYGSRQRRSQIGMAVLITLPSDCDPGLSAKLRNFIFSHIFVIENEMDRLTEETTKACLCRSLFISMVSKAWSVFCQSFQRIFTMERLSGPVWLSLMRESNADVVADRFLTVFVKLITQFDVKNTNFFVSTLLTSALLNHLTWVSSVAPVINSRADHSKHFVRKKRQRQWIENRDISHPYNPLWMQFMDVIGGTSLPSKISRFLVIGGNGDCVNQFIYLLSYFLRCSEVNELLVDDLVGKEFTQEQNRLMRLSQTPSKRSRHSSGELHRLQNSQTKESREFICPVNRLQKQPDVGRDPADRKLRVGDPISSVKLSHGNSRKICNGHAFSQEQAKELAEKLVLLQNIRQSRSDAASSCAQVQTDSHCSTAALGSWTAETYRFMEDGCEASTSQSDPSENPWMADLTTEGHQWESDNRSHQKMPRRRSGGENFSGMELPDSSLNPFFIRHKHLRLSGSALSDKANLQKRFGHGSLKQRNLSCPVFRGHLGQSAPIQRNSACRNASQLSRPCRPLDNFFHYCDSRETSSPPLIHSVPITRKVSTATETGSCGRFDVIPTSAPVNILEPTSSSTVSSQCTIQYGETVDSVEDDSLNDCETGDVTDLTFVSHKSSTTAESTRKTSSGYGTGADPSVSASHLCTHRESVNVGMGESTAEDLLDPGYSQPGSEDNRSDAEESVGDPNQSTLDCRLTKSSIDSGIEENDAMDYMRQEHKKSLQQIVFGSASVEPLPGVTVVTTSSPETNDAVPTLGRSVLAPYGDIFQRHCVLSGCRKYSTLAVDISEELSRQGASFENRGEQTVESLCVIADTSDWSVKVMSSQFPTGRQKSFVGPANSVVNMVENVKNFRRLQFPSSFCLTYIEECLAELYAKSCTLLRYLDQWSLVADSQKLADVVGCDVSDLPLLVSIASAHSPDVLCMFDT